MKIRPCEKTDEIIWIQLNREFMNFEIQDDGLWNHTQNTADDTFQHTFQKALENQELITLLLIEWQDEIIGFINLMTVFSVWAHGKALILDDLYIREEYRGKGIGRKAMEYLERYGKQKGYKRLQFQSESSNPDALAFYTKIGYTPANMYFYVKYL